MVEMLYLLFIFIILLLATFAYGAVRGAPWLPTRFVDVERFLNLCELKPEQKVYDLGSGDGRLVCAVAKNGGNAVGYEVSLFPYLISKIRYLFCKNKAKTIIKFKDFWNADISDADVVYFFQIPRIYSKLKNKLEKELKKGVKVVAYVWPVEGWEPVKIDKKTGYPNLYLYEM
jgi:SAM-dependent methyltransferase